jgi:hypothetical protein
LIAVDNVDKDRFCIVDLYLIDELNTTNTLPLTLHVFSEAGVHPEFFLGRGLTLRLNVIYV